MTDHTAYIGRPFKAVPLSGPIRLGTDGGSDFLYIGDIAGIDYTALDDRTHRLLEQRRNTAAASVRSGMSPEKKLKLLTALQAAQDRLDNWKPIRERTIVDIFPSTFNDDVIVMVEGTEGFEPFCPDFVQSAELLHPDGALKLEQAILKTAIMDLRDIYKQIIRGVSPVTEGRLNGEATIIEREILANPFGTINDPEGLIEEIMKLSYQEVKEEEEGKNELNHTKGKARKRSGAAGDAGEGRAL